MGRRGLRPNIFAPSLAVSCAMMFALSIFMFSIIPIIGILSSQSSANCFFTTSKANKDGVVIFRVLCAQPNGLNLKPHHQFQAACQSAKNLARPTG